MAEHLTIQWNALRLVTVLQETGDQRPIKVMINVTAADANSIRASQSQIAAEAGRAIERAGRNR